MITITKKVDSDRTKLELELLRSYLRKLGAKFMDNTSKITEQKPRPRLRLEIWGGMVGLGMIAIAGIIYNPDLLRPLIKLGIPLHLAANLPLIGNAIQQAEVPAITVQQLKQLIDHKTEDFLLVDVREIAEYEIARIPGSVLIPLPEIEAGEGITKIKSLLKGRKLIAHCKVGVRSAKALVILKKAGIEGMNLKGGINAWSREIDPAVPLY